MNCNGSKGSDGFDFVVPSFCCSVLGERRKLNAYRLKPVGSSKEVVSYGLKSCAPNKNNTQPSSKDWQ